MANFNADEADYRMACVKLQSLTCAAKSAQLAVRVILANELGSAEAAKALLTRAGLEDPFACDEAKIREMPIPPQADAVPAQPSAVSGGNSRGSTPGRSTGILISDFAT